MGVGKDNKGGECVYAFSWVPQCVDPISTRAASATPAADRRRARRGSGVQVANGNAYVYSGCITVIVPLPGIVPPPTA